MTRAIWENPIVRRELHGFGHRLRDWRLWVGVRLPREPREWGLPAIAWFALAPYILWVLLVVLGRVDPSLKQYADPGTIFDVFLLGLGTYACAVATVIGATTVTREREQATWEQVTVTPMTASELVLGYWLARALPLAIGVLVSLLTWIVLYPLYLPLLERLGPFDTTRGDLIFLGLLLLTAVMSLNAFGLMVSTICRSSAAAAVAALVGAVVIYLGTWSALVSLWDRSIAMPVATAMLIANATVAGAALLVAGIRLRTARCSGSAAPGRSDAQWSARRNDAHEVRDL